MILIGYINFDERQVLEKKTHFVLFSSRWIDGLLSTNHLQSVENSLFGIFLILQTSSSR